MSVTVSTNGLSASIDLPQKYSSLLGSHRTLKERFVAFEGVIRHEEGKPVFVDRETGETEELWKVVPYRLLSNGAFVGITVSGPGITLAVKGEVKKEVAKGKGDSKGKGDGNGNKAVWFWYGPGGAVRFHSLLDRLAPFLADGTKIEIVIWK